MAATHNKNYESAMLRPRTAEISRKLIAGWVLSCGGALWGCACTPARGLALPPPRTAPSAAETHDYTWQPATHSPSLASPPHPLRNLAKRCSKFERGLMQVADQAAQAQLVGRTLAHQELKLALRAAGVPHVGEHSWSLAERKLDLNDAAIRLDAWLASLPISGELRCGISRVQTANRDVLTVMAIDAVGDLAPLPTRARVGQWLSVDAQFMFNTLDAKVVVMGPRGEPRPLLTPPPHNNRVRAQFNLAEPGAWLIQVLTADQTGPRPALEALVFVDSEPFSRFEPQAAPGEEAGKGALDARAALQRMTNEARAKAGLPPLSRSAELDALADQHARAMLSRRELAHNLGSGGPAQRIATAGLEASIVGENLAVAKDAVTTHRVLWSSPAHRSAILNRQFTTMGVGVAESEDRSIWVCELFANFGEAGKIPRPD